MDFTGAELSGGRVTANLRPSAENGVFVAKFGGDLIVGKEINFTPRSRSQEVADGDLGALGEFIKPDPSNPGRYTIEGGSASLESEDNTTSYGLNGEVTEYSPVEAQLQDGSDLSQTRN